MFDEVNDSDHITFWVDSGLYLSGINQILVIVISCILWFGGIYLWLGWHGERIAANLVVKDGRMTQVQLIERPFFFNDTDAVPDVGRLTILAVSTSPNPSVELTLRMTTDHETVDTHPTSGYNIWSTPLLAVSMCKLGFEDVWLSTYILLTRVVVQFLLDSVPIAWNIIAE